jgi:hypothetical protein
MGPLLQVIVNEPLANGVEVDVFTVKMLVPEPPVRGLGLKLPVAPDGRPLTAKLTGLLNPLREATVKV